MPVTSAAPGAVCAWVTIERDGVAYALAVAPSNEMTIYRRRPNGKWHAVDRGTPVSRRGGHVEMSWEGSAFVTPQTRDALRRRLLAAQRRGEVKTGDAPWRASA